MAECPKPTQDVELNLKNRQKAIDKFGYGPFNPNEKNAEFWQAKADMWNVSDTSAKKQLCGNCGAFNRTESMLDCISKGLGDTKDDWDVVDAGQLGYCEMFDFKCAASRTCDAWIDRSAKSSEAKVAIVDVYLKTVQELLGTINTKGDRISEGSYVEWNSSGGKARGRVEHVMYEGTLGVPDSDFSINATEDDPAVLIRIWREGKDGWGETETLVGHRMSTLSRIDALSKKSYYLSYIEEKATRKVRDSQYWGRPVGTPITPGMKPEGPTSPIGRARAAAGRTGSSDRVSSAAAPRRRVAVSGGAKKPTASGSGGGKKPPKKPTSSASGGDKPKASKAVSDAKKMWESDATASDLAAARQLEKEGWNWQEDSENSGTYGLSKDGKNFAVTVTPGSDRYGMDEDIIASAYERSKGDKPIPEASTFDYDKLTARQQREYRALTRAQRAEYEERWNARSADSTRRANERREAAQLTDSVAAGESKPRRKPTVSRDGQIAVDKYNAEQEGLMSPKAQAAGRLIDDIIDKVNSEWRDDTPGKVSMNIGIAKDLDKFDVDGISDEERSVLAEKFGKIDRSKIMDKWQGRLDNVAEKLGASDKPKRPKRRVRSKKPVSRRVTVDVGDQARDAIAKRRERAAERERMKEMTPDTSVRDAKDFSVKDAAGELGKISKDGRPDATGTEADPIDVGDDVELAHQLLSEGKHIRMKDERAVSTLLDKLHETVKDAKAKGADAPEYDLCKVSVPKTNLFCVESKGIPRVKMPQFKGAPVPGSFADTKKNDKGEGDVEPEFRDLLKELGIGTEMKTVKANELKASQDNLDGPKVVGMAQAMREGKIPDAPIFVTKDGYILDGHHRWAAKVAIDLDDGVSGDIDMPVEVIDAEIGYLIDLANGFTEMAGIKPKGLGVAADAADSKPGAGGTGKDVPDGALGLLQAAQERGRVE